MTEDSFHRTLDAALAKPHGDWRVDHLVGHTTHTTWHETVEAADAEVVRLRLAGVQRVVSWCAEGCCGPEEGDENGREDARRSIRPYLPVTPS